MKNASPKLQAAYVHFAHQLGALLESKGAEHKHGLYRLRTPGGLLGLRAYRNWIICRFANPVGGFIVTRGLSQEHNGHWNTNYPDDVDTLTADNLLRGFEFDLDQILTFELTDEQRQAIEHEAEARARQQAAEFDERPTYGEPPTMTALRQFATFDRLNLAGATSGRFHADVTSAPRPSGK